MSEMQDMNIIFSIKDRTQFLAYIEEFEKELSAGESFIENNSLKLYLSAMGGWISDFKGLYHNMNWPMPENISWETIGFILIGSFTGSDYHQAICSLKTDKELSKLLLLLSDKVDDYCNEIGLKSVLFYLNRMKKRVQEVDFVVTPGCTDKDIPWFFIAQIIDAAVVYE